MKLKLRLEIQKEVKKSLTPEIPNVSEDATKDLDEEGIVREGC